MADSIPHRPAPAKRTAMRPLALTLLIGSIASAVAACAHHPDGNAPATVPTPAADYSLFGRRARITYPQFVAEVSYVSPSELRWKTIAPDGTVAEGREAPIYKRLSDHQHFLSWIESDGFTVSQVIDTKQLLVVGFGSYSDETSQRGRRAGTAQEGTIAFVK